MKILLIEDHRLLSESLKNSLLRYSDIQCVETVDYKTTERDIISKILSNSFDLLLIDINIKKILDIDGLELCRDILKEKPDCKIIILTGYDYYAFEKEAKKSGAVGFLNKDIETDRLYNIIKEIIKGKRHFKISEDKLTDLTDKELEIINLYAQGFTRNEVASELFISLRTLANHLNIIYDKLDVKNYQEMLRKATLLGYIKKNIF